MTFNKTQKSHYRHDANPHDKHFHTQSKTVNIFKQITCNRASELIPKRREYVVCKYVLFDAAIDVISVFYVFLFRSRFLRF